MDLTCGGLPFIKAQTSKSPSILRLATSSCLNSRGTPAQTGICGAIYPSPNSSAFCLLSFFKVAFLINMQTVNKPNVYGGSAAVGQTGRAGLQVPIAICGIAIRLPGGIKSPRALWEFLIVGGDARGRVPPSRFDHHRPNSPEGHARIMSEHGYFLDDDLRCLDVSFFNMPPAEVERMDPQQRLLLEVVRECLEDAGETRWRGEDIGCYVGKLGDQYPKSGQGGSALSARISDEFNLKGPRYEF